MHESEASTKAKRASAEREKEKYPFPPRFIFYHKRSTDFEEKIEGL